MNVLACLHACVYACVHVCMYVYVNIYIHVCVVIDGDDEEDLSEDSEGLTGFALLAKKKARILHSQVREIGSEVRHTYLLAYSCLHVCMNACLFMYICMYDFTGS